MAGPSKQPGKLSGSRPSGSAEIRILKSGAKRTVLLIESPTRPPEGSRSGSLRVVKRFHSPGLGGHRVLGALGDRRRAAAEARALRRAQAFGLPVPTPGPVERSSDGGWELSMVAIPGARPLSEVFCTAFTSSTWSRQRLQQLAERTGALARQVEAAGFLHADPHPANVIVGQDDQLWIVDLARSRVGQSDAAVRRGLIRALSRMREHCPRTLRRRIALAWIGSGATPEWTRRIEREATALRVEEMKARVRVWMRTSSATEVRPGFDGRGEAVWVRACAAAAPAGWTTKRESGSATSTGQIWDTLVRAKLHGIPGCEPRALALTPPHAVEFDVPKDVVAPSRHELHKAQLRLADRGLRAVAPDDGPFIAGPSGAALVAPHAVLEATEPGDTR